MQTWQIFPGTWDCPAFFRVPTEAEAEKKKGGAPSANSMDFLRHCAARLDEGAPAEEVLALMRTRYTTLRCLNVKTCLVRQMCTPRPEYREALDRLCAAHPEHDEALRRGRGADATVRALLRDLPPQWEGNVLGLKLPRAQMMACKRQGARSAIAKNSRRVRVDGRALLRAARAIVREHEAHPLARLALAVMLVTGRRTCEILNGRSALTPHGGEHAMLFEGIAKRRGGDDAIVIPVLAPAEDIVVAVQTLRAKQRGARLVNGDVSRRYQSLLCRELAADPLWASCKRVHGLRAVYAGMALRLFEWPGDGTDAFVAMCILGHTGLQESLVYTTYHVGDDFAEEPRLGVGLCTAPRFLEEETAVEDTVEGEGSGRGEVQGASDFFGGALTVPGMSLSLSVDRSKESSRSSFRSGVTGGALAVPGVARPIPVAGDGRKAAQTAVSPIMN